MTKMYSCHGKAEIAKKSYISIRQKIAGKSLQDLSDAPRII